MPQEQLQPLAAPAGFCRQELEIALLPGRDKVLPGDGQRALANGQAGRHKVQGRLRQGGGSQGGGEPAQANLPPMRGRRPACPLLRLAESLPCPAPEP